MSQPTAQRPPQVTMAAGVVMFSSVLVLLTAWESLSSIRSLSTREAVEDILADAPASSMGLGVDGVLDILYFAGVLAAIFATAAAILGWYVTKPDIPARRALTIVAVPLFLTGLVTGGFAASFVAAGTAMLWMQPAREWFATGKWTPPSPPSKASPDTSSDAAHQVSGGTPTGLSSQVFSAPSPDPSLQASSMGQPTQQRAPDARATYVRPPAVIAAFVLTVVVAGGVLVLSMLSVVLAALAPEFIMTEIERQRPEMIQDGLTLAQLQFSTYASAVALIVWAGAALIFSGFVMARRAWARRGLMVTAAFSAVACFVAAFGAPVMVLPALAAAATAWSLSRREVRHWFDLQPR